jgi:hypothetical protein
MVLRLLIPAVVAVVAAFLSGCEADGHATLVSDYGRPGVPIEEVELHLASIDAPYTLIANLEAEADTVRFSTAAEAEAAVYEKLRKLAARSGADAVIDVQMSNSEVPWNENQHTVVRATAKAVLIKR